MRAQVRLTGDYYDNARVHAMLQNSNTPPAALLAVLALLAAAGCSDDGTQRTDPEERVSYRLPAGWEPIRGSSETRFRATADPAVSMQITTVAKRSASVEQQRDTWLESQRRSGAEILYDEDWAVGSLQGVAYGHTAEGMRGDMHWHHIVLDAGDFLITTYLQTPPDGTPTWLPVYRDVVGSIAVVP